MYYRKKNSQFMQPWTPDLDMSGVSVSEADVAAGSPKEGDMIAYNADNPDDRWLVAKAFFEANYEPAEQTEKALGNTDANGAKKNVKDIVFWGNGDLFKLISKASSQSEGWMKSTKAMETPFGVVVQVTTQQRNPDGSYAVAEALTFIPGAKVQEEKDGGTVVARAIA